MRVRRIGRLQYLVESRSQWEEADIFGNPRQRVQHLADLEPQPDGGKYFCSCHRFCENTHHHGTPCQHLEAAYNSACRELSHLRGHAARDSSDGSAGATGRRAYWLGRPATGDPAARGTKGKHARS